MNRFVCSRVLRAAGLGLGIGLISAFFLAICVIAGWPIPVAFAPVFGSLAIAAAITGIAAEYSPLSGRAWGFILGAGGVLAFFFAVMIWRSLATGDRFGTTPETWAWILGITAVGGILGSSCFPRFPGSVQQTAARDRAKSAAREQ